MLAVSEAVSNAVEHGYGVRPGRRGGRRARGGGRRACSRTAAWRSPCATAAGGARPSQLRAHRRHGIPIMKACVAECVIDGTPSGTTVVLRSHPPRVIDPPRCGRTLLVCVDGPSGAGKTELAARVGPHAGRPAGGAHGRALPRLGRPRRGRGPVCAPRSWRRSRRGGPPRYRRWDWARDTYGEHRDLGTPPLLVVEGVGAGTGAWVLLIWVDAPEEVRYRRAMARDGAAYAPHWARWAAQERAHFAADRTRRTRGRAVSPGDRGVGIATA